MPTNTANDYISSTSSPPRRLSLQLGAAATARLFINTARRFPYPFAPALSRGLGVPLPAITSLIAVNQATGILGPLLGSLGDRWGYRVMMLVGLAMLTVGMFTGGFVPIYSATLLALFLAGLGKNVFDPALQAYVGAKVPYHQRGRAIGFVELSWSGSSLIGIPLVGLLIDKLEWRSPFFVLGGLGLLSIIALRTLIPANSHHRAAENDISLRTIWQQLRAERAVIGALAFTLLTSMANDNLFVVYGAWLESAFGLSSLALGAATTVIGIAELSGEGLTASLADRLGLRRAIITGATLSALSYLLLPLFDQSLSFALIGLFIVFITFEFTLVVSFSLFTEILPSARATMMSANLATAGLGRVIGSFGGGMIWLAGGITAIGGISALASGLAVIFLLWGLRDWGDQ